MAFILRTIVNGKDGFISDNWKLYTDIEEMKERIEKVDPDEYECFDAKDITEEIFLEVEKRIGERERLKRKTMYEKLKMEFG